MTTAADHLSAFLRTTPSSSRVLAGESSARFRRRVLLERAAHLMVATDRTLLDIALDSGFTGQATFATAFRGEFDVLPSVWRANPTSYAIDTAGDVHFHPPGGLRLPARQRMDGVDLVVEMVEHHVRLVGELVDRAGQVCEADLGRVPPTPGVPTIRSALSRLIDRMEKVSAAVHGVDRDDDVEEHESVASVRSRLDRIGPAFVDDVSRLAATGRFDETFVDAFSATPREVSFGAMVADLLTGGAHHRLLDRLQLLEPTTD